MRVRRFLLGLSVWFAWPSCTTDHGALTRDTDGGKANGGQPSVPSGGAFGGAQVITGGKSSGGSAGRAPDEPPGANVLTIVHGIVDAERVRLCFRAGAPDEDRYIETPERARSLSFGESTVIRTLEGVDFAKDDLQPLAITGELELVEDLDCSEAVDRARVEQAATPTENAGENGGSGGDAPDSLGGAGGAGPDSIGGVGGMANAAGSDSLGGKSAEGFGGAGGLGGAGGAEPKPPDPPRLRLGELPAVPAGTLESGRSFLLVMDGCIGGPAFVGRLADDACGTEYSASRPTLGAVFAPMSRTVANVAVGFQVLHASLATGEVAVQSAQFPVGSQSSPVIADALSPGVIAPRIPRKDLSRVAWGAGVPGWRIEVFGGGSVVLGFPWKDAFALGGLDGVEEGKNYVLVLLGPRLDLTIPGFWNSPAVTIVESDPTDSAASPDSSESSE